MSNAILITNLVLGGIQLIVTALLHLRIKAECCNSKDSIDIEPVDPPASAITPSQLQPVQPGPLPLDPLQPHEIPVDKSK